MRGNNYKSRGTRPKPSKNRKERKQKNKQKKQQKPSKKNISRESLVWKSTSIPIEIKPQIIRKNVKPNDMKFII